jgi:hypothetical protein
MNANQKKNAMQLRQIIREEVRRALREVSSDFTGTGLKISGRTQIDNNEIGNALEHGGFDEKWNVRDGYWFIKAAEEELDDLEQELDTVFKRLKIRASFEPQF